MVYCNTSNTEFPYMNTPKLASYQQCYFIRQRQLGVCHKEILIAILSISKQSTECIDIKSRLVTTSSILYLDPLMKINTSLNPAQKHRNTVFLHRGGSKWFVLFLAEPDPTPCPCGIIAVHFFSSISDTPDQWHYISKLQPEQQLYFLCQTHRPFCQLCIQQQQTQEKGGKLRSNI